MRVPLSFAALALAIAVAASACGGDDEAKGADSTASPSASASASATASSSATKTATRAASETASATASPTEAATTAATAAPTQQPAEPTKVVQVATPTPTVYIPPPTATPTEPPPPPPPPTAPPPQSVTISAGRESWNPSSISVTPGSTVTFTWSGMHNLVGPGISSAAGNPSVSGTYATTLSSPGTYTFSCQVHPGMDASVTVQ